MDTLYEDLTTANRHARIAIGEQIAIGMRDGIAAANEALYTVCGRVILDLLTPKEMNDYTPHRGEFKAHTSRGLIRQRPRVQGFLRAINRAPQAKTIIDAGCGSSAVLTLGAAVFHPQAEVTGYEINEPAARCARRIIELFGYDDRVTVHEADVIVATLPHVDLAVTETFNRALLSEPGPAITAALAKIAKEVLPAYSVVSGCDTTVTPHTIWQQAAVVDLSVPNEFINGHIASTDSGLRPISVRAEFYDARHDPILTANNKDPITEPSPLGEVDVPSAGTSINFRYPAGVYLQNLSLQAGR